MKKLMALLLSVMMVGCLGVTALAAEEENQEMVPILAEVPEDWENPFAWAWADDGTNAFAAWPGEAMEQLGDTGWYYIYVPSFVQNVIISANEASVQTAGDAVEAGREVWIAIADDLTTTVSYEQQSDTEIPTYVETFPVHAYVPLEWENVSVVSGDGGEKDMIGGEDGWFTASVPVTATSLVLTGNSGAASTESITIEPREVWVTVYNDLSYEVSYEDPDAPDAPPITVYAQVPEDWAGPCCWAWSAPDGTNAFSAWPGEAMTEGEDGWYSIEVPGWVNSIIINANAGGVQTTDLSVEVGKDVWISVSDAENAAVSYEQPSGEAPEEAPAPSEASTESAPEDEGEGEGNTIIWIVVAAVVIVAVVAIAVAVSKKKKK